MGSVVRMSTLIGIDLNGVLDCVASLEQKNRYASFPPIVVTDTPQGLGAHRHMKRFVPPLAVPRLARPWVAE